MKQFQLAANNKFRQKANELTNTINRTSLPLEKLIDNNNSSTNNNNIITTNSSSPLTTVFDIGDFQANCNKTKIPKQKMEILLAAIDNQQQQFKEGICDIPDPKRRWYYSAGNFYLCIHNCFDGNIDNFLSSYLKNK